MSQCLALYDPARHRSLGFRHGGYDPGMAGRAIGAHALWFLGEPDQALEWSRGGIALARDLRHIHTLVFALAHAGILHYHRREPVLTLQVAEEAVALAADHGIRGWEAFSEILRGWALVNQGFGSTGIERMRRGLEGYRVAFGELESPLWLAMLADAYRVTGAVAEGLSAVAEGLERGETIGVRFEEAELLRLRGELLLLARDSAATEEAADTFRSAIDVASRQQARSVALRAAMSLARATQGRGASEPARLLLADIHGRFTEGFETDDLREARVLLEGYRGGDR